MEPSAGQPQGIQGAFRRLAQGCRAIALNRLELFLLELQEERVQFFQAFLLGGVVLVFGSMTLAVVTCTIVALCLRWNRFDLLVGLALLYLAGTILAFLRLRKHLKNWTPFSATSAELKKDLACLEEKT